MARYLVDATLIFGHLYQAAGRSGFRSDLDYTRALDEIEPSPLPGTDGAASPFFSPDGQWVGFFADGKLKKISVTGGAAITLCDSPVGFGGTWAPDDTIIFADLTVRGLSRISASGGTPEVLTTPDAAKGENRAWPEVLPGGKAFSQGQRGRAVLGTEVPSDVILTPGRQADLLSEPKGLPFSAMNADQQGVLWQLIEEYARNAHVDLADSQLARVDAAGRENIHFGWIGSAEPGQGHYYRIHGPTFVIEYDNPSGNHSHTVWRDLEKDFGEDLLLKHYEQNHVPQEHR